MIQEKNILKMYFETGDKPTQTQYENLIDSLRHMHDKISMDDLGLEGYDEEGSRSTGIITRLGDFDDSFNGTNLSIDDTANEIKITGNLTVDSGTATFKEAITSEGDINMIDTNSTVSSELLFENDTYKMGIDYQNNRYLRFIDRNLDNVRIFFDMTDGSAVFDNDVTGDTGKFERLQVGVNNQTNASNKISLYSTNDGASPITNVHTGSEIILSNLSTQDGNFSALSGYNANSLVSSRIAFVNQNVSNRYGSISFMTHDGVSLAERLNIGPTSINVSLDIDATSQNITAGNFITNGNLTFSDGGDRKIFGPTNEDLIMIAKPNASNEGFKVSVDNEASYALEVLQNNKVNMIGELKLGSSSISGDRIISAENTEGYLGKIEFTHDVADDDANGVVLDGANEIGLSINGSIAATISSVTSRFITDIEASSYKLTILNTAPSSSTDTGTTGEIRYTTDYIYVCTATNTWKRTALSTW